MLEVAGDLCRVPAKFENPVQSMRRTRGSEAFTLQNGG